GRDHSKLHLAHPEPLRDILSGATQRIALLAVAEAATAHGRLGEALRAVAELEALPGQRRHPQTVEARRRLAEHCQRDALRSAWRLRVLTGHSKAVTSVAISQDN